jgi:NADH:ubiquinone oxidoreductase subunit K
MTLLLNIFSVVPIQYYIYLSAVLFSIGAVGCCFSPQRHCIFMSM